MSKEIDKTDGYSIKDQLYVKVAELIELARKKVSVAVNLTMVHTYFEIGRIIIEDEQKGKERAEYGKAVLKDLSMRLTQKFGRGFSVENLDRMRFFYKVYSNSISSTLLTKLNSIDNHINTIFQLHYDPSLNFTLGWTHYLVLMRIENPLERSFYEIEAYNQNWSERELKRQYNSSLYERLALSRNKEEVMKLSKQGQTIVKPEDILKNPLTLEFLGLEEKDSLLQQKLAEWITEFENLREDKL